MGALHAGHTSLITEATRKSELTIVSIFVNPTQFGKNEDLSRYPRPIQSDIAHLEQAKTSILFLPTPEDIYPNGIGNTTIVSVPGISTLWCGHTRPGHFDGVTSIVARLLTLIQPTYAFFGEKDFQQFTIIKKMVQDLFIPTQLIPCPIIRESDGLAMSSRNRYLSASERKTAIQLFQTLTLMQAHYKNGEKSAQTLIKIGKNNLQKNSDIALDYLTIVNPETLQERPQDITPGDRLLIAAYVGSTRLIDNIKMV